MITPSIDVLRAATRKREPHDPWWKRMLLWATLAFVAVTFWVGLATEINWVFGPDGR